MFTKILIANRGEIALRIIRTCRQMGIQTVAVFSEADRESFHVRMADEAFCIGAAAASDSYNNMSRIISAAEIADVEAIHPGYGFLAENSHFAEICESCKIKFIGPSSKSLALLGNKTQARKLAEDAGLHIVPGGAIASEEDALKLAHKIGFPVIIKAAAGGGGRGMRIAHNDISLVKSLFAARSEAEAAFKDGSLYLEKFIENPRHIEIQIMADDYGNIIHLGERDCSMQRRFQKLIEESPSPVVTSSLRNDLGRAAIKLAKAASYSNACTVEFLLNSNNQFYFIEANARLQVEHPVTEMVTGIDIVELQLRIASEDRLRIKQRYVNQQGHSIECRINAEDPDNNFKPSPGRITYLNMPGGPGVRVDSHVCQGSTIPSYYDSLVAKLIVHRRSRKEAIACMRRALSEMRIEGIKTTIPLNQRLLASPSFQRGEFDTGFVERFIAE